MENMMFGISIVLMILTGAVAVMAGLMLCIFVILLKGINQHIRALQGIYDLLAARDGKPPVL